VIDGEEVYAVLNITDKDVMEMLQPFAVIMKNYRTVISQNIWNCYIQKHLVLSLSLSEVATNIWVPVFIEIQQLIEKFCDKSITLKEIDYHLKNVLPDKLEEEIFRLVEGYNLCSTKPVSTTWISQFVKSVNYYGDTCKAQTAAQLILTAKDALMLTGNFQELENFKLKVYISSLKYI